MQDFLIVLLTLYLDDLRALRSWVVDESSPVVDDQKVAGEGVAGRAHRATRREVQLVKATMHRDIPVDYPVGSAGAPGNDRFLDLSQRQHRMLRLER